MPPSRTDLLGKSFPIKKLPPKVLSVVFAHCIPVLGQEPSVLSKHSAPLNIASVCKEWRDLVVSDASIWSSFEIKAIKTSVAWIPALLLWLRRSQGHPLSFRVEFDYLPGAWDLDDDAEELDGFEDTENARTFYRCWKILQDHQGRWKDVEIVVKQMVEDHPTRFYIKDTPLLENLRMHFDMLNFESPTIAIDLVPCTRIRSLELHGSFELGVGTAQFSNLRKVDIFRTNKASEYTSIREFVNLLSAAPQLEAATASLVSYDPGDKLTDVRLEHLRSLSIDIYVVEVPAKTKLFQCLTLPRLTSLEVKVKGRTKSEDDVSKMIQQSRANIINLKLDGEGMQESEIRACLEATPKLEKLCLGSGLLSSSSLMADLTVGKNGLVKLCPLLRILELTDSSNLKPPQQAKFEKLVVSRWSKDKDGPRTLATVKIHFYRDLGPIGTQMAKCISDGLQYVKVKQK